MTNIWFTSDTHLGHQSMVTKGWRPFSSIEEHDGTLIEKWNCIVRPRDAVWHLGDFSETLSIEDIGRIIEQLNGDIHLVAGNHDAVFAGHRDALKKQKGWLSAGFRSVQPFTRRKIGGRHIMLSHFPYTGDHTEGDRYNEYRLTDTGMPLLHGHVHDAWSVRGNQVNVGVDVHGWTPVSIDTIASTLKEL